MGWGYLINHYHVGDIDWGISRGQSVIVECEQRKKC